MPATPSPRRLVAAIGITVLAGFVVPAPADAHASAGLFQRIATVPAYLNSSIDDVAAAEISTVTGDGKTIVYTDSPGKRLGFIDITDPAAPKPSGVLAVGGEPTSVSVLGDYLLAAINTSPDLAHPSGSLIVIDAKTRTVLRTFDLGGQPDSVAVAPSGRYIAVAIENERDEDLNDGAIPQAPAGYLSVVDVRPQLAKWALSTVALTGLAKVAPSDPEPEYVSINALNEAVVSLQENNHIAVVQLRTGKVVRHFPAGSVTVSQVDAKDDDAIVLTDTVTAKREPDGVAWLDNTLFATANEGDYEGGSRTWSIIDRAGRVVYDSGNSLEHLAVRHGLYPDKRSDAKGIEPENVAFGRFGGVPYVFVGAERGNFVAVYDVSKPSAPRFVQILPTTNGPEGVLAVPSRGLLVVSSEEELPDEGIRGSVQIYRFGAAGAFPSIVSKPAIAWGALSGLAAVPGHPASLTAITDSVYSPTRLLTIDTTPVPAAITAELTVTKGGKPIGYDAEGIAARADGGHWLAVEGATPDPNLLVRLNATGAVQQEVPLPADVAAAITSNGLEGVAVTGSGAAEQVWVAVQRALKGDPAGIVRIGRYTPATGAWAWLGYPLDAAPKGWIGLSELVAVDADTFAVIERDNQRGPAAVVKKVYAFDVPSGFGTGLPTVAKRPVADLLPALAADHGWVQDKVEGLAVAGNGTVYAVTDNDGIDDATGETVFLRLGALFGAGGPAGPGSGAGSGSGSGGGAAAPDSGSLPVTGVGGWTLVGVAALLTGAGVFLVVLARRRRRVFV